MTLRATGSKCSSPCGVQMRSTGVGHDTDRRLRKTRQVCNLTLVIRTHLDDRVAMRRIDLHQHERDADVIVEIAARHQARTESREDRADQLLRRRLAVASHHADERDRERVSPMLGEAAQRDQRVVDPVDRDAFRHGQGPITDDQSCGSGSFREIEEVVRVEPIAPQRHEQVAFPDRARVRRNLPIGKLRLTAFDAERPPYFRVESWRTIVERAGSRGTEATAEATVKLHAGGERIVTTGEGNGPVNALDHALRLALGRVYPEIDVFELIDFKVRILDTEQGTDAITRVLIETTDGVSSWSTVGVGPNLIEAAWEALTDSAIFGLVHAGVDPR